MIYQKSANLKMLNGMLTEKSTQICYNHIRDRNIRGKEKTERNPTMWKLTETQITNEDEIRYTAYGFVCGETTIADFSSVKSEALRFIELLNEHKVSPLHIYDVIEDHFAAL